MTWPDRAETYMTRYAETIKTALAAGLSDGTSVASLLHVETTDDPSPYRISPQWAAVGAASPHFHRAVIPDDTPVAFRFSRSTPLSLGGEPDTERLAAFARDTRRTELRFVLDLLDPGRAQAPPAPFSRDAVLAHLAAAPANYLLAAQGAVAERLAADGCVDTTVVPPLHAMPAGTSALLVRHDDRGPRLTRLGEDLASTWHRHSMGHAVRITLSGAFFLDRVENALYFSAP